MVPFATHNCVVMRMELKGPPLALPSLGMLPTRLLRGGRSFAVLLLRMAHLELPWGMSAAERVRHIAEQGWGRVAQGVSAVLTDRWNDCSPYVPSSLLSITSHGGFPRHQGPVCTNPSLLLGLSLARPLEKPQMQKDLVPTRRARSSLWVPGPP